MTSARRLRQTDQTLFAPLADRACRTRDQLISKRTRYRTAPARQIGDAINQTLFLTVAIMSESGRPGARQRYEAVHTASPPRITASGFLVLAMPVPASTVEVARTCRCAATAPDSDWPGEIKPVQIGCAVWARRTGAQDAGCVAPITQTMMAAYDSPLELEARRPRTRRARGPIAPASACWGAAAVAKWPQITLKPRSGLDRPSAGLLRLVAFLLGRGR